MREIIDPKLVIHYYVDAGTNGNKSVAAYIRKGFKLKKKNFYTQYYKGVTSDASEIKAIMLAVKDAEKNNFDPKNVIIHTDQENLFRMPKPGKKNSRLYDFKLHIESFGYTLFYMKSNHNNQELSKEEIEKHYTNNSYLIHALTKLGLDSGPNRLALMKYKKKYKKT